MFTLIPIQPESMIPLLALELAPLPTGRRESKDPAAKNSAILPPSPSRNVLKRRKI